MAERIRVLVPDVQGGAEEWKTYLAGTTASDIFDANPHVQRELRQLDGTECYVGSQAPPPGEYQLTIRQAGSRDASFGSLAGVSVQDFWADLSKAQISADDVLELPRGVFFLGTKEKGSRLMVRQAYTELWDVAEDLFHSGCRRLVVRGTPGIGKSWWLFFVMYKAACAGATVVLDFHEQSSRFLFRGGIVLEGQIRASFKAELADEKTWYLADGGMPDAVQARTIAAVSPARSHYYQFTKAGGVQIRFMPLWSLDELEKARQLMYKHITQEQLQEKYELWGGAARYCLEFADTDSNEDVATVKTIISSTNLAKLRTDMGRFEISDEVSNRIVHWSVSPDFKVPTTIFASEKIRKMVVTDLLMEARDDVARTLPFLMRLSPYASLSGALFETTMHHQMQDGGDFLVRDLERPETAAFQKTFPKPSGEMLFFRSKDDMPTDQACSQYCVSASLTFAAVDSLMTPNSLFQATVADAHPVKLHELANALNLLPKFDEYHLYFAVPAHQLKNFKKQDIITAEGKPATQLRCRVRKVKQFALKIVARSAARPVARALVF